MKSPCYETHVDPIFTTQVAPLYHLSLSVMAHTGVVKKYDSVKAQNNFITEEKASRCRLTIGLEIRFFTCYLRLLTAHVKLEPQHPRMFYHWSFHARALDLSFRKAPTRTGMS